MNQTAIIMVSPQMGENIGAAARVMKNFGLLDLRIVNPRDGWPNQKAESVAVGAIDLLKNASLYNSLAEAVSDIQYLYATTALPRDMNKPYIKSKELPQDYPGSGKVGIIFGRESSGLCNDEIAIANKIINIDTSGFSSLNIAQSIAIICYELAKCVNKFELENSKDIATKQEITFFLNHLEYELDANKFFRVADKKRRMLRNITNIFTRIDNISTTEIQILRGIISSFKKNND
ncbi:MAG: RNA methyltransferase [Rickettsiaceae bacterium]|nr:MAG: RNA methyltransferase [Rickettsiaceae bacterium]